MSTPKASSAPLASHDLWHSYEAHVALRGIDLTVQPGSVLGLIGRNGAGEFTLIRALLGLLVPSRGHAEVLGEPALHLSDRSKERLAYVPQQAEAFPWLRAEQMLSFIGRFYPRGHSGYWR
jgi:ABC-2 type transport system ATP-binding protein